MASTRITILKDRRPKPTGFDLEFTTSGTPWTGFPVEEHTSPEEGSQHKWCYPKTHVVLNTQGHCEFEYRSGSRSERLILEADTVSVLPRGFEMTFAWKGWLRFMVVEIDPLVVARLLPSESRTTGSELVPQIKLTDYPLVSLLRSIEVETKSGSPSGRVYGDSLSLALLAYIDSRFSAHSGDRCEANLHACLSNRQKKALADYIRSHLERDLSLDELSSQVDLSPGYFCRVFKNSFGESPHQYLTRVRIEEAGRLLSDRRIAIIEVARRVGFSSQSHLTAVFRKFHGVTPRLFRQQYAALAALAASIHLHYLSDDRISTILSAV